MREFFTDSDLVAATGLHLDNIRKLVTWGAVKPAKGGKGRGNVRLWSSDTAKHIACVSALVNAGLSLKMAHTLVYLDILGDIFLDLIDPEVLAMNAGDKYGWFDPSKPLDPDEGHDFKIYIADGKYVFVDALSKESPIPKGILSDGVFRTYVDFNHFVGEVGAEGKVVSSRPKWEPVPGRPHIDPSSLAWEYDKTLEDESAVDWEGAFAAAISVTQVNLSLAAKVAMRRLLGIPVFFKSRVAA